MSDAKKVLLICYINFCLSDFNDLEKQLAIPKNYRAMPQQKTKFGNPNFFLLSLFCIPWSSLSRYQSVNPLCRNDRSMCISTCRSPHRYSKLYCLAQPNMQYTWWSSRLLMLQILFRISLVILQEVELPYDSSCPSVGRLVSWSVDWFVASVCHNILKDQAVTLPSFYRNLVK